jgi:eukaryotic-like serine/threonine-protein kinase
MGEVYLAEHSLLPRPCAIKLIRPEKAGDQASLVRFEREAQETAKLENPNTIRIFDCGRSDEGSLYLVMEYLRGLTFQQLVDRYGPLPPERVAYFLLQVCASLREAHGHGLIHRDVKPSNIMACNLGGTADVVKLLDFGLVQTATPGEEQVHPAARHYLAGTPAYLSPEQASGHGKPDARSDIYSLGAVGYFLLTGEPPFVRDSPVELIVAHREDAVPPISNPWRAVLADLESIILRCLEKEPARRFLDVAGLEGAVSECACAGRWTKTDRERWWLEHPVPDDSSPCPIAATPTPN